MPPQRRVTKCAAPGEVLHTAKFAGDFDASAQFGRWVAEPLIFHDYVATTNGMPYHEALILFGFRRDWAHLMGSALYENPKASTPGWTSNWPLTARQQFEYPTKRDYVQHIMRQHPGNKKLNEQNLMANKNLSVPDILTLNGVANPPPRAVPPALKQFLVPPRLGRNEFYEIKPDTDSQRAEGSDTISKLVDNYREWGLPYRPGIVYPVEGSARIEFELPAEVRGLLRRLMRNLKILRLKPYLSVRRAADGLLAYKLCIDIEWDDERIKDQEAAKSLVAKCVASAILLGEIPQAETSGLSFEELRTLFPRELELHFDFDVIREITPFTAGIGEAITQNGLALPGDNLLLFADYQLYRELTTDDPTVQSVWREVRRVSRIMAGPGFAPIWDREFLVPLESIGHKLFSKHDEYMFNAILRWMAANKAEVIGLIIVPLILSAGLSVLLDAGIIATEAASAADITLAATEARASTSLGRFAMRELTIHARGTAPLPAGTGYRGLLSAEEISAQLGRALGVAANDTATASVLRTAVLAVPRWAKNVGAAAAAITPVVLYSKQARAATTTTGRQLQTRQVSPIAPVVAESTYGIYVAKPDLGKYQRPPSQGAEVNIYDYTSTPLDKFRSVATFPTQPQRTLMTYVGQVRVS